MAGIAVADSQTSAAVGGRIVTVDAIGIGSVDPSSYYVDSFVHSHYATLHVADAVVAVAVDAIAAIAGDAVAGFVDVASAFVAASGDSGTWHVVGALFAGSVTLDGMELIAGSLIELDWVHSVFCGKVLFVVLYERIVIERVSWNELVIGSLNWNWNSISNL